MEQTEIRCPICRTIEGKEPNKGPLCEDCASNDRLKGEYDGMKIMKDVRRCVILYVWVWPVVLVLSTILQVMSGSAGSVSGMVVAFGLWIFTVFWLYPQVGISRVFWRACPKLGEIRERLFVLKLKGKPK